MQEDRSQHRNRAKAMAVLRARLYDFERQKRDAARAAERRGQVGSGDRSERIRTYNFPQGRVSDHRIDLTLYKLPQVIEGEALGEIIDALVTEHQAELLAAEATPSMTQARSCARRGCRLDPLAGASIDAARRGSRAAFARTGSRRPSSMRASSSAMRSGSITPALAAQANRVLTPEEAGAIAGARGAAARARTGRAHPRRKRILGPAVQIECRHPGASAGNRNRGRGGARRARSR